MNNNYSCDEFIYYERILNSQVSAGFSVSPVVVVTGARQVGKSTFLQNCSSLKDFFYITLDDFNYINQAISDPFGLLSLSDKIIIDEIQKVPSIFNVVKQFADNNKNKKIILSGSSNILLMKNISESLAGRALYFKMFPLTLNEMNQQLAKPNALKILFQGNKKKLEDEIVRTDYSQYILTGLLPKMLELKNLENKLLWLENYILTYLERDLRELTQIASLIDFRNVMQAVALSTGRIVNQSEISRNLKISQSTISRYLNILEISHLIYKIPAYTKNKMRRLMKSPKYYWFDPGIASHLSGYYDVESLKNSKDYGFLFENFVYQHLIALSQQLFPKPLIYHWRTTDGLEVDFILEQGRNILAVEVKSKDNVRFNDCKNLVEFIKQYKNCKLGILIYSGNKVIKLSDKIYAVPIGSL